MRRALQVADVTPAQKLLLVALASYDGPGGIWPSITTLAGLVGVTPRQVRRMLVELGDRGLVVVDRRAGGDDKTRSDRRPNRYVLLLDDLTCTSPRASDDGVTPGSPRRNPQRGDAHVRASANGVTPTSERGDTHVRNGVTPTSPEPSQEPANDHSLPSRVLTREALAELAGIEPR
jgi:hypothetical protein